MSAPFRLGLYGALLVVVFAAAAVTAGAIVPESAVKNWSKDTAKSTHDSGDDMEAPRHDAGHEAPATPATSTGAFGLGLEASGYRMTAVTAPRAFGTEGDLSLVITDPKGNPVTDFKPEHKKELHLIVVRADGQHFRHVHPERDSSGTWSIPWTWDDAGTYRVFADFAPAKTGENLTLSTTVQVAGDYAPVSTEHARTASVDGYDVTVEGTLTAGTSSTLTMRITKDGEPVTTLQPYLGAFGHLVALREGDLAYLHVHPHGDEPKPGDTSGPEIVFEANAPTPGRYLLYLDFQIDGQVHSAPLVLDTADQTSTSSESNASTTAKHEDTEGTGHDDAH